MGHLPENPTWRTEKKKTPAEAQLKANRENAQKSTGPKTDEGKKAASKNALKHGLRSRSFTLIHGEDAEAYEQTQTRLGRRP